jgi:hypothetical protein
MDTNAVEMSRQAMEKKTSEELRIIYAVQNENDWTKEAFEAIRLVLEARGESIPLTLPKPANFAVNPLEPGQKSEVITCNNCGKVILRDSGPCPHSPPQTSNLVGIGGWLILTAIGFILGPIIGIVAIIWELTMVSKVANAGFGVIYALKIATQTGIFALMIYTATLFFGKKRNAPAVIITFFQVTVVTSAILLVIELAAGAEVFAIEEVKALFCNLVGAAIWIRYFRVSKRVKATFVD